MPFRERLTFRLIALLVVLLFTLLWVLGRDIQIGDNTYHPDAITALLVAVGAVIWYMFPQLSGWADKPIPVLGTKKANSEPAEKDLIKANREELLKAVDQTWLSGLLDHLLNQQESLKIGLEALEPDKLAQRMGSQPYPLTDNQAVLQTFNDFGRKLVLLGEPGAGKTVLILQLARLLWNAAKRDEHERIPIIFPLASWAAKQLPLKKWLIEEMRNRYGAPEKLAKALVESEQIIFLLDGLDEVTKVYREKCLKSIKAFVENKDHHVEYVLCSRRKEFEDLQTRLNVPGEIFLKPLTSEQINEYLKREPFVALRGLLTSNTIIRDQFATVPFMLNTMAYVTCGKTVEGLRRLVSDKEDVKSLRAAFLEEYVTQRLIEKPNEKYSNAKTRHWLRWLAAQLIKHDETDFYLENMQPNWLKNQTLVKLWRMIFGFMGNLVNELTIDLSDKQRKFSISRITMIDQLHWSLSGTKLSGGLEVGMLSGLAFGVTGALFFGLIGGVLERIFGVAGGFVSGLLFGIVTGIVSGLLSDLESKSMLRYRVKPGQGIQRSLRNGLLISVVAGLGLGLMLGMFFGLIAGLLYDPASGLIKQFLGIEDAQVFALLVGLGICFLCGALFWLGYGLNYGLGAFIQHYILRWMLAYEGNLPFWRYDKFLDYANDLVILRKVGGGYRFTHDMLRQHLAGASAPKADS